jgi:hypothetical protein
VLGDSFWFATPLPLAAIACSSARIRADFGAQPRAEVCRSLDARARRAERRGRDGQHRKRSVDMSHGDASHDQDAERFGIEIGDRTGVLDIEHVP